MGEMAEYAIQQALDSERDNDGDDPRLYLPRPSQAKFCYFCKATPLYWHNFGTPDKPMWRLTPPGVVDKPHTCAEGAAFYARKYS